MASRSVLLTRSRPPLGPACLRPRSTACPACGPTRRAAPRRWWSSTPPPPATATPRHDDARAELEHALVDLQRRAPKFIEPRRLQLALQSLRQHPGNEVVRVAVFGLARQDSQTDADTAGRVLSALLADPLVAEQPWEAAVADRDRAAPLVVRVAAPAPRPDLCADEALPELRVSSPALDGLNLEFLLMDLPVSRSVLGQNAARDLGDALLAPSVVVPSAGARVSPVITPVHRALVVAQGLDGAVDVSTLTLSETGGSVKAVVQLSALLVSQQQQQQQQQPDPRFTAIDVSQAERALRLFRQGPQHAMEYERLWSASNLPALSCWLRDGASPPSPDRPTKPAVRQLVASLLRDASSSVRAADARRLSGDSAADGGSPDLARVDAHLAAWAQRAHAELRDELDVAFTSRRWRRLGWWKLFWRVDDVAMLTGELLAQRFLPTAEQELVYLAGRIADHAGPSPPRYPQPASSRPAPLPPRWPGHIAFTRRYLQDETVPALQSLAQRLVLQSMGTSGATGALAALLYVSSAASSLYEAGAVAALGLVYSLGRMQRQWEAARNFWEGEVREEGRKAVRGAEESMATAVLTSGAADGASAGREAQELQETRDLVARAEAALSRMR